MASSRGRLAHVCQRTARPVNHPVRPGSVRPGGRRPRRRAAPGCHGSRLCLVEPAYVSGVRPAVRLACKAQAVAVASERVGRRGLPAPGNVRWPQWIVARTASKASARSPQRRRRGPGSGSNRAGWERGASRARVTSRALVSRAPGCPSIGVDLTASAWVGKWPADDLNVPTRLRQR